MLTPAEISGMLHIMHVYQTTQTALPLILLGFLAITATTGATTRDTALDHRLPPSSPPIMDLSHYRCVQERPNQNPELAVAMAISGGGHRAANFAVGVLLGLENVELSETNSCNLLKEVDYFSTVSGGGFAAGAYLSSQYDHQQSKTNIPYSFSRALQANNNRLMMNLERDYQSTVIAGGASFDLIGYKDIGDILEQQFDNCILGADQRSNHYSLRLGDIFLPSSHPSPVTLPYWLANATVYENGARFIFTPDMLEKYYVREYTHRMTDIKLGHDYYSMPFAVAVKTSASFPVAIPATTFICANPNDPLNDYLHLLDGGLLDNLGVRSAFEALQQDPAPRRILLVIDAYKGTAHPLSNSRTSPSGAQAAYRITKIALDADHSLLKRNVLKQAAKAATDTRGPIEVVFLSFEDLKPENTEKIVNIQEELADIRKKRSAALLRRMQREINERLPIEAIDFKLEEDTYALYHDARAIATSLDITAAEQKLLHDAGRAVVEKHHKELKGLLSQ
jgi:hypothetical protein